MENKDFTTPLSSFIYAYHKDNPSQKDNTELKNNLNNYKIKVNADPGKIKEYLVSDSHGYNSFQTAANFHDLNALEILIDAARLTGKDFYSTIMDKGGKDKTFLEFLTPEESVKALKLIGDFKDTGHSNIKPSEPNKELVPKKKNDAIRSSNEKVISSDKYQKYIPNPEDIKKYQRNLGKDDLNYFDIQNFVKKAMDKGAISIPNNVSLPKSSSILKEIINRIKKILGVYNFKKNKDGLKPNELRFLDNLPSKVFILPDGNLGSLEKAKFHKQHKVSDFKNIPIDVLKSKDNYINPDFLKDNE